jgi:hypothetical protein
MKTARILVALASLSLAPAQAFADHYRGWGHHPGYYAPPPVRVWAPPRPYVAVRPVPAWVWVAPRWAWDGYQWAWQPGYWARRY